MSEREIRSLLRTICDRLDERARRVTRKVVVPSVLGASLALSGCGDGRPVSTDAKVVTEAAPTGDAYLGASDAAYGAPLDGWPLPPDQAAPDAGPQPDYLAPDAGPVPLYMGTPPPDKP